MDKTAAISALRLIHRMVGDTPAVSIYAKEAIKMQKAVNDLQTALRDGGSLARLASDIAALLENGLLALPPGKSNRERVLLGCEELMRRLDPKICAPDW